MLSRADIEQFARACSDIGDEAADETGFVAVRHLLRRFGAELKSRPLLVEAMLASTTKGGSAHPDYDWSVVVDSETHKLDPAQLEQETSGNPLGARLRNTVAHELTHSLAFRYSEFGIRLEVPNAKRDKAALIESIEQETERLSPLLLIPDTALRDLPKGNQPLSVHDLCDFRRRMGVSREVLISRLNMLRLQDKLGLLNRDPFRNIAVGVAEWENPKEAVLRSWPLYAEFDRNIIPEFLRTLKKHDRLPLSSFLSSDLPSLADGGVTFTTPAAALGSAPTDQMKLLIQGEYVLPVKGKQFLFMTRNTAKTLLAHAGEHRTAR